MMEYQLKSIVARWVAYYHDQKNDAKWQAWAATNEHLDYLIDFKPWEAWTVIVAIHMRDQSRIINESLCNGPIENLLSAHGEQLIDTIATYARKNPSFVTLLKSIWRGAIPDEVWLRVQEIRDPYHHGLQALKPPATRKVLA